jgi:hypothetical protein
MRPGAAALMSRRENGAEDLKAIGYVSRAAAPVGSDELTALEQEAHRHNRAADITGLLVFDAGCYVQVLEGPAEAVEATLDRIRRDARHEDLEQVLDMPIGERSFPHWALASIDLEAPAASADIFDFAGGLSDFLGRVDAAPQGRGEVLVLAFRRVLALLDRAQEVDERGRGH